MQEDDPFHQYYKYMKERVAEDAEAVRAGTAAPAPTAQQKAVEKDEAALGGYEPKPAEFMVDLPGVTAHDLDILRLTALFHARRGRSFLSSLSIREGRNYQFDFLRPTHSLYGYYNRMVESYQKIMQPPPGLIEALVKEAADPDLKWKTLEDARKRTEWERGRRKREDIEAKQREEEAAAYAAIDWQDFVVVETIEFTQNDMDLELPPPTSVERLKSMSMAEKRMASMVMEETGAGPTGGEQLLPEGGAAQEEMEIEDEEEEEAKTLRIKAEQEQARAREVQTAALQSKGIKIKKDYVPKGKHGEVALTGPTLIDRYQPRGYRPNGQMSILQPVDSRKRALRAHSYRATRPEVEGATSPARNASRASSTACPGCRCFCIFAEPRGATYRSVRRRVGRGSAETTGRGSFAGTKREGEDYLGWTHQLGSKDGRHVPNTIHARRTDQKDAFANGSRGRDTGKRGWTSSWTGDRPIDRTFRCGPEHAKLCPLATCFGCVVAQTWWGLCLCGRDDFRCPDWSDHTRVHLRPSRRWTQCPPLSPGTNVRSGCGRPTTSSCRKRACSRRGPIGRETSFQAAQD